MNRPKKLTGGGGGVGFKRQQEEGRAVRETHDGYLAAGGWTKEGSGDGGGRKRLAELRDLDELLVGDNYRQGGGSGSGNERRQGKPIAEAGAPGGGGRRSGLLLK